MSKKLKKKETKFTIQTLIRVLIFAAIIYFLILFFSSQQNPPKKAISNNILGTKTEEKKQNIIQNKATEIFTSTYNLIPENSRKQIENINQNPFLNSISEKFTQIQVESQKGLDAQIKNIKKEIAKSVYNQVIKNIDSK